MPSAHVFTCDGEQVFFSQYAFKAYIVYDFVYACLAYMHIYVCTTYMYTHSCVFICMRTCVCQQVYCQFENFSYYLEASFFFTINL